MKLSYPRLKAALDKKNLLPCYLVSGDEPLQRQRALDAIRAGARAGGFDGRELHFLQAGYDWGLLGRSAMSLSLFAERRIIELRLSSTRLGREGSAAITELLAAAGEDFVVIVEAPRLDKSAQGSKWVKAVERGGAHVQVWPLGPRDLPAWIDAAMREVGLRPDADAVRLLAERVEGNLLAADQEIRKLALLLGEGAVSGAQVVEAVADSSRYDVYKLVDAAVAGQGRRAIRMLGRLRAEGLEPVIVAWALTRELRLLGSLAEQAGRGGIGSGLQGVWESRRNLLRACVGRHSLEDFYRLLKRARAADAAAKGQSGEDFWGVAAAIVTELAAGRRPLAA